MNFGVSGRATVLERDAPMRRGSRNAGGEVADGKDPDAVETAIHTVIEKLKTEPVPAKELQKVKNNFAAAEYRRLTSNHPILMQIIRNEGTGDWRELNPSNINSYPSN